MNPWERIKEMVMQKQHGVFPEHAGGGLVNNLYQMRGVMPLQAKQQAPIAQQPPTQQFQLPPPPPQGQSAGGFGQVAAAGGMKSQVGPPAPAQAFEDFYSHLDADQRDAFHRSLEADKRVVEAEDMHFKPGAYTAEDHFRYLKAVESEAGDDDYENSFTDDELMALYGIRPEKNPWAEMKKPQQRGKATR